MLLSNLRNKLYLVIVLCALLLNQAVPAMAHSMESKAPVAPSILLSKEHDRCTGQLSVFNTSLQWQVIPRGHWTKVYVKVNSKGFWLWKCGSVYERSRSSILPYQVHRVDVWHSKQNGDISWYALSE